MKIYFVSFGNEILNDDKITIICYIILIYEYNYNRDKKVYR